MLLHFTALTPIAEVEGLAVLQGCAGYPQLGGAEALQSTWLCLV